VVRVAVVDDHEVVRKGVESVLEKDSEIEVLGCFSCGSELCKFPSISKLDVVIMDLKLPDGLGADWAKKVKEENPNVKVLILTGYHTEAELLLSLEAGVDGYIFKEVTSGELINAVKEVAKGNFYLSPEVARKVKDFTISPKSTLTSRELEVLLALKNGLTSEEIAHELCLSLSTVKTHLRNIYQKLGVRNRVEAVREGIKRGLISEE
jgi:NarL family two-component system response regulator LiaR